MHSSRSTAPPSASDDSARSSPTRAVEAGIVAGLLAGAIRCPAVTLVGAVGADGPRDADTIAGMAQVPPATPGRDDAAPALTFRCYSVAVEDTPSDARRGVCWCKERGGVSCRDAESAAVWERCYAGE